jgi:PAS domain S-box-containing protein
LERTNELVEEAVAEATRKLLEGEIELHRLAAVVQQSGDAIISISTDGTIRSWNYGAERLYQYTAEEMIGRMYNPPLPEHVKNENHAVLEALRDGKSIESMETTNYRKDGELIDVSLTISPIRGADDQINAFAMVSRDITQKKIAERRISEFYSVISHELRTPLTSIRGALTLISEEIVEPGSDEAKELVDIAQNSTSRLIRLINDILDLRKIEAGKFELNLVDLSSKELVESAANAMQGFAEEKKVSLSIDVADDYQIEGDEDRLTQVLSNLISNALKYAPEGSAVDVAAIRSNHSMRFMVTDHGPGIPAEYHSKLFGKFQQVDASDTRAKEGSGLGLAISKAIVEQHGGTISFESEPGIATVFIFEVPLSNKFIFAGSFKDKKSQSVQSVKSVQPTQLDKNSGPYFPAFTKDELSASLRNWPAPDAKETSAGAGSQIVDFPFTSSILATNQAMTLVLDRASVRSRKILIVEDDAELVSLLRINLERQNYECLTARTLEDARDLIETERPDALVLDLELPDGDGLSLLGLLPGKTQSGGRIPVVVITGSDRTMKKGESSIVDWLQKPFHQGNLTDAVDRAFKSEDTR